MRKIIIAVDGYSATGKSTTARLVADKLGYTFIDTGAMYRAVALYFLRNDIALDAPEATIRTAMNQIQLAFQMNPQTGRRDIYLNGENVEQLIRTIEVSQAASKVSALSIVRRELVAMQQEMGRNGGVVMDGRDIGTVVFPQADLKLFLVASLEVRVRRRMDELTRKGKAVDAPTVQHDLQVRDHQDSTRADSPLVKADDAIEIDTSDKTIAEQVEIVYEMARELIGAELNA